MKSYRTGILVLVMVLSEGCKKRTEPVVYEADFDTVVTTGEYHDTGVFGNPVKPVHEVIYGDTVWVFPYGNLVWSDTLQLKNFSVYISASVDTTDFLIDTVKSAKGSRLVIGFNQYYILDFKKDKKPWFTLLFNKKRDLYPILYGTDFWHESNLNIVNNIFYNERFERIIIELAINSGAQFSGMFYLVANTAGTIEYLGTISSWGGGGPDGIPFLTEDGQMFVTCSELYNFTTGSAIHLTEYTKMAQVMSGVKSTSEYVQLHGLRYLSNNNFLLVFNRYHNKPKYNAVILNTDSFIISQFGYFGLIEDIDAVLLYEDIGHLNRSYLYDTEREVLIQISKDSNPVIEETKLYEMIELNTDSLPKPDAQLINFGFYGPFEFYIMPYESVVYYKEGRID